MSWASQKKSPQISYDGNNREGRSKCDESYHHIDYKDEKHAHPIESNPISCYDNNLTYKKSIHDEYRRKGNPKLSHYAKKQKLILIQVMSLSISKQ